MYKFYKNEAEEARTNARVDIILMAAFFGCFFIVPIPALKVAFCTLGFTFAVLARVNRREARKNAYKAVKEMERSETLEKLGQ